MLHTDFFAQGPLPGFDPKDAPKFKPKKIRAHSLKRDFNCYAFAIQQYDRGMLEPGELSKTRQDWDDAVSHHQDEYWQALKDDMSFGGRLPEVGELLQGALAGAIRDGCLRLRAGEDAPEGYYPIALIGFETFYDKPGELPLAPDIHFLVPYRNMGDDGQKEDGYLGWAQKPGKFEATRRDHDGALITDPREATFKRPGQFHTFLAVPKGGITPQP